MRDKRHRPSARAIIFDSGRSRILAERNSRLGEDYLYFPGGGIEFGETARDCLLREFEEEFDGEILGFEFLFLVENFMPFEGEVLHGIELFCEVRLESEHVEPRLDGFEYRWLEVAGIADVDLRPWVVRDRIADGTYRQIRHLISHD